MITDEKIITTLKELKNTSPRADFKNRMENLIIASFVEQNKKRSYFWMSPRFLAPFLLAFILTFTTLTSVAADSQPGDIFFPFKNTAVKIQSAFIQNSPTPTPTPTLFPSLTPTPSVQPNKKISPAPTITKIPVKPTVKLTVKPSVTLVPTKAAIKVNQTLTPSIVPTYSPPDTSKISPTIPQILNFNISPNEADIHLSL